MENILDKSQYPTDFTLEHFRPLKFKISFNHGEAIHLETLMKIIHFEAFPSI